MAKKVPMTMLHKYEDIIKRRYAVLELAANRATAPLRHKIVEEVKNDWGIYKLELEISALKIKQKDLEEQLYQLTGRSSGYKGHTYYSKDSKVDEEVTARLKQIDGVSFRIAEEKQKLLDDLWLADAPEKMVSMIAAIDANMADFMNEVKMLEDKVIGMGLQLPPMSEIDNGDM